MCVSDPLTGNLRVEEAAIAPLGVASPQIVESVSENEEDSPTGNDCTSLTLVDAVQGESASLLAENQDCGVEAAVSHEGACSAAPVAQNEKSLNSAIANKIPELVGQGYSASVLRENQAFDEEVKANYESEVSAALVPNPEKWSHEAIVARSNMRPERVQKLKVAANSGQNPGVEYLLSCWQDDPALQIVIKKLLVKFPQWGIAIVDGALVDWER
ncbi:Methyl-accepting chemotaxis protein [Nostoc flagelliforme CCNUN1]|uniref:Methyl-accepting chemotaxis protein n=1 Tax=Nostoc flagelliforme CCNUN1 TaxID=2038116 RepID=A0A2K8T1Q2_9NOSO|nr:hypothetical protein [Nostoc flagelliforme]AUB41638.1 Methyl-accepting chemotaxis protein [Nostoc flagelliforme CCNUN1]